MKTFFFAVLLATLGTNASAGEFASTCRKLDPDNKYLGAEDDAESLGRCVLEGFGAHYSIPQLQELEAACLKEGKDKRLTVAADARLVDGKPKPELYLFCWSGR